MAVVKASSPVIAFAALFLASVDGYACSRRDAVSSVGMVNHADAIVRAAAVEYVKPPRRFFPVWTDGETVRFEVLEIIRGPMPSLLILPGISAIGTTSTITCPHIGLCVRMAGTVVVTPIPIARVDNFC